MLRARAVSVAISSALRDVLAFGLCFVLRESQFWWRPWRSALRLLSVTIMGATQRATLAVLAATLGGLATRNSFVSEQREEHWLQCSPSRHTALSSRHAGPAWLKTAYEATGLNATTDAPPTSSWRNAPLAFLFADSETPAEATPTFLATARVLQGAHGMVRVGQQQALMRERRHAQDLPQMRRSARRTALGVRQGACSA